MFLSSGLLRGIAAIFRCVGKQEAFKFQAFEFACKASDGDECSDPILCCNMCSPKATKNKDTVLWRYQEYRFALISCLFRLIVLSISTYISWLQLFFLIHLVHPHRKKQLAIFEDHLSVEALVHDISMLWFSPLCHDSCYTTYVWIPNAVSHHLWKRYCYCFLLVLFAVKCKWIPCFIYLPCTENGSFV